MNALVNPPVIWRDLEISGVPASCCDVGNTRLYVCQRRGVFQAWVDQSKVGYFATIKIAKEEAERFAGLRPPRKVKVPLQPVARAYVTDSPPPIADLTQPPATGVITIVEPEAKVFVVAPIKPGHCKCGARLGRSGRCPALCEPVPAPPPVYTGPLKVGRTHIGRLAAPVTGWIGGAP